MSHTADILDRISAMKATGERFALATVVRTVAATAAMILTIERMSTSSTRLITFPI